MRRPELPEGTKIHIQQLLCEGHRGSPPGTTLWRTDVKRHDGAKPWPVGSACDGGRWSAAPRALGSFNFTYNSPTTTLVGPETVSHEMPQTKRYRFKGGSSGVFCLWTFVVLCFP